MKSCKTVSIFRSTNRFRQGLSCSPKVSATSDDCRSAMQCPPTNCTDCILQCRSITPFKGAMQCPPTNCTNCKCIRTSNRLRKKVIA